MQRRGDLTAPGGAERDSACTHVDSVGRTGTLTTQTPRSRRTGLSTRHPAEPVPPSPRPPAPQQVLYPRSFWSTRARSHSRPFTLSLSPSLL